MTTLDLDVVPYGRVRSHTGHDSDGQFRSTLPGLKTAPDKTADSA